MTITGPLARADFFAPRVIPGLPPCPRLAIGTAALGGCWGPADQDESIEVLHDAWNGGFTLTDTAPVYQQAEAVLGQALSRWSGQPPVICTKIEGYPAYAPPGYAADWPTSFEKQLRANEKRFSGRMIHGLAMHDIDRAPAGFAEACNSFLIKQVASGRIAVAGMGGSGPASQAQFLPSGNYRYAITYKRLAAVTLQAMADLIPLCSAHGVALIAASPLYMGLLGAQFDVWRLDPPGHIDAVFARRAEAVNELARQAGIALPELSIRFLLSMPAVDFVLAGARNLSEWRQAAAAYDAGPLDADLFAAICRIAQAGQEPQTGG